jgi:ankyrin repeat protein
MRSGSRNFSTILVIFFTVVRRSLPQVEYFFEKYGMVYSLDQRDEYGHSPAHWVALNGHAHITRYRMLYGGMIAAIPQLTGWHSTVTPTSPGIQGNSEE